jgi:signal transduction histidine kinase
MMILERTLWGSAVFVLSVLLLRLRRKHARLNALSQASSEAIIHDLKNPMSAVMGCLSYLLADHPEREKELKVLTLALRSCRAQLSLLETLVDASRLESNRLSLRKESVDVGALLDECLNESLGTAAHMKVALSSRRSPSLPGSIVVDRGLMARVLSNLVHNSLKYTPAGGKVSLDVDFAPGKFLFRLSDTGIGIAPEHLNLLFGKYYRVEGVNQGMRRGSGLGLYFCRQAVEAHGGSINVRSGVGSGTTIEFDIPQPAVVIGSHL